MRFENNKSLRNSIYHVRQRSPLTWAPFRWGLIFALLLIMMFGLMLSNYWPTDAQNDASITYVALGDSLTAGIGSSEVDQLRIYGFVPRLTDYLRQNQPLYVENHGIPGLTSEQLIWYLQNGAGVPSSLRSADMITLSIGGNDLLQLIDQGLISEQNALQRIEQYSSTLESILTLIRSYNDQVPVYILGLYSPYESGHPLADLGHQLIPTFNTVIKQVSGTDVNTYVVDVYDLFHLQSDQYTHINRGDIHPNDEGYRMISEAFIEQIDP